MPPPRGSEKSASNTSASGCTGPPTYTGSPPAISASSGTTDSTAVSEGRLRTIPIAPSSLCSVMKTTVRAKFGSASVGEAISSLPRSESSMPPSSIPVHSAARCGPVPAKLG